MHKLVICKYSKYKIEGERELLDINNKRKQMKLLILSQCYYPETFSINTVAPELKKRGFDVTVLTGYPNYPMGKIFDGYGFDIPYETNIDGVKIVRVKARPRKSGKINLALNYYSFYSKAYKWLKKNYKEYDLIYCFEVSPITSFLPAARLKKKVPYIMNVQDMWPECFEAVMNVHNPVILKPLMALSNYVYKGADKLLCSSKSFCEEFKRRKIAEDKLVFWPQFANDYGVSNETVEEYKTPYRFVFAGNIGKAQGLDLVLDTAKITINNKEIGYYLIGDGTELKHLKERVEKEELSNVYFLPRKPEREIPRYLCSATSGILILEENILSKIVLPQKMQMYMACKLPILCVMNGEAKKITEESGAGYYVEADANKISEKIFEIINDENREEKGINGRKYFEENFNKDKLIDTLSDILQEEVSKK